MCNTGEVKAMNGSVAKAIQCAASLEAAGKSDSVFVSSIRLFQGRLTTIRTRPLRRAKIICRSVINKAPCLASLPAIRLKLHCFSPLLTRLPVADQCLCCFAGRFTKSSRRSSVGLLPIAVFNFLAHRIRGAGCFAYQVVRTVDLAGW